MFVKDLATGMVIRVSTGTDDTQTNSFSNSNGLSLGADGTTVTFVSNASNLVAGDTNGAKDVFAKDLTGDVAAVLSVTDDGSRASVSTSGKLLFVDVDPKDTHAVAVTRTSGDVGTLSATLARDSLGNSTGLIDWTYTATHAAAVAALASGQTRTDTFTVEVTDGQGGTAERTVSVALTEAGHAAAVKTQMSGQTLQALAPLTTSGTPGHTFVFDPGHTVDVVQQFRVAGVDHDTLSIPGVDFDNSIADVLRDTHNVGGSAVITDPTSGDTVWLAGITKAELKANQGDFAFHG